MTAPGDDGGDETVDGDHAAETVDGDHAAGQDATRAEWRTDGEEATPGVQYPADDASQRGRQEDSWQLFAQDVLTSVFAVGLIGLYLFAISGVWPPMVAIESPSMDPHMQINDLVFVMETDRFQPADAHGDTGVVTARIGTQTGYEEYGKSGDVIIFEPDGNGNVTPIIHRAMFWVEEGENWCEQANGEFLGTLDRSDSRCTADNAGFITKGDNNGRYDQAVGGQVSRPVKPEWVIGTAELRVPRLGWFRLQFQ